MDSDIVTNNVITS